MRRADNTVPGAYAVMLRVWFSARPFRSIPIPFSSAESPIASSNGGLQVLNGPSIPCKHCTDGPNSDCPPICKTMSRAICGEV